MYQLQHLMRRRVRYCIIFLWVDEQVVNAAVACDQQDYPRCILADIKKN